MKKQQLKMDSVLDEITRMELAKEKREADAIIAKLDSKYKAADMRKMRNLQMQEGTVIIVCQELYRNEHYTKHFYRTVMGYHNTVGGPEAHLIWEGSEEWPEEPVWGGWNVKQRWIYPDIHNMRYWETGEVVEPIGLM